MEAARVPRLAYTLNLENHGLRPGMVAFIPGLCPPRASQVLNHTPALRTHLAVRQVIPLKVEFAASKGWSIGKTQKKF